MALASLAMIEERAIHCRNILGGIRLRRLNPCFRQRRVLDGFIEGGGTDLKMFKMLSSVLRKTGRVGWSMTGARFLRRNLDDVGAWPAACALGDCGRNGCPPLIARALCFGQARNSFKVSGMDHQHASPCFVARQAEIDGGGVVPIFVQLCSAQAPTFISDQRTGLGFAFALPLEAMLNHHAVHRLQIAI